MKSDHIWLHTQRMLTLPALQKSFVNLFVVFAWGFGIEKLRGFLLIFSGLHFLGDKARKILENVGEISEENSGENSGRKFEKSGTSVLQLF